jgi:hypothetical protein
MHHYTALSTKMHNSLSQDIIYAHHTMNVQVILMVILTTRMYSKLEKTSCGTIWNLHCISLPEPMLAG